jgi:hypothetical protein
MPRRPPEDFAAEVEAHLQQEIDRLVADGLPPAGARDAALRAFGSPTRARDNFHLRSRSRWFEQFAQNLRYAGRGAGATAIVELAAAVLVVVGATGLAAYAPSRRATRIDPANTLRAEA